MRNLRKLIAAVIAVVLVLTSMTAVFAADSSTLANADKAATLKDLGLYSGQDANDPIVGLESALTTQDSLIFLAKLFGYNEAATKLSADQVAEALAKFDDAASISDYAKNIVAYSAANGILSGSTQNDKFFVGAKDTVTAARFATFMLRQMGYTVPDFRISVAQLAETKGSKVDATITGDLIRDAAVGIMYGALTAEKSSGKTVIADIVRDNNDLKAKAEKLGLIEPETIVVQDSSSKSDSSGEGSKELRVVSVKALNTKQVEIMFNLLMDKDSAQDKANYEIKDMGNVEKILTDNCCKLGDDMKTVTITLDSTVEDCLTNSSTAKVIISKDIMDANGKKLGADKEVEVEVQDGIIPTVKEIKATGEKNIKITFSEPVYEGNNNTTTLTNNLFAVNSGTYTYFVQKAELNLDVINLEVGTKLIEGPVTVTVNDTGLQGDAIQDCAGYKVFKSSYAFNYVKDTSVPVVTVKSAKGNKVVLNFSKPVKGTNIKLYHSEKNNENYKAEATTTGYVDEISFTYNNLLPIGSLNLYLVNSETNGEKIIDSYGIPVPDQSLICSVADDPEIVYIKEAQLVKKNEIKVVFNTNMASIIGSDIELANLTTPGSIKVSKCELIDIDSDGKTKEAILTLDKDLSTDVRDEAGSLIGITTIAKPSSVSELGYKLKPNFSILLNDKTRPEIVMWDHDYDESTDDVPKVVVDLGSTGIIKLFFSEDINESNLGEGTFEVDGFTITDITASDEPTTVVLTVNANTENIPVKTTVTQVSDIFDKANNALVPGSTWTIILDYTPTN